jgi:hypothetical protein
MLLGAITKKKKVRYILVLCVTISRKQNQITLLHLGQILGNRLMDQVQYNKAADISIRSRQSGEKGGRCWTDSRSRKHPAVYMRLIWSAMIPMSQSYKCESLSRALSGQQLARKRPDL